MQNVPAASVRFSNPETLLILKLRFNNLMVESGEALTRIPGAALRLADLRERVALKRKLAACDNGAGMVFVHQSGRDCDGVTHSRLVQYPSEIDGYNAAVDAVLEQAEGPESFHILTPEQAARFVPDQQRDLVAEAFEDGHSHVLYN